MGIIPADLTGRFPEMANLTTQQIQYAINDSAQFLNSGNFFNVSVWGAKYDTAHIYLAAHYVTMMNMRGRHGRGDQKVGPLSRGIITPSAGSGKALSDLNLTSYGEMFLQMARTLVKSPFVLGQQQINIVGGPSPLAGDTGNGNNG